MAKQLQCLRDLIKKNLRILFVGTSPGPKSAEAGHYFAGNSNVFWKLLYESGLTRKQLTTLEDKKLLDYGYGLTDVVKEPSKTPAEIKLKYTAKNTRRINRAIDLFKPKIVAFVGKTGFRYYSQNYSKLHYGFQYNYHDVRIYLLPSTSGQSYADTSYEEKLECFKNLKKYLNSIN